MKTAALIAITSLTTVGAIQIVPLIANWIDPGGLSTFEYALIVFILLVIGGIIFGVIHGITTRDKRREKKEKIKEEREQAKKEQEHIEKEQECNKIEAKHHFPGQWLKLSRDIRNIDKMTTRRILLRSFVKDNRIQKPSLTIETVEAIVELACLNRECDIWNGTQGITELLIPFTMDRYKNGEKEK